MVPIFADFSRVFFFKTNPIFGFGTKLTKSVEKIGQTGKEKLAPGFFTISKGQGTRMHRVSPFYMRKILNDTCPSTIRFLVPYIGQRITYNSEQKA